MTNDHNSSGSPLDPENWDSLKTLGCKMVSDMFDQLQSVSTTPVWSAMPLEVVAKLRRPLPRQGTPPEAVYEEFTTLVARYPRGNVHPRFWGWVNGSGVPIAMLADFLASAINATVGSGNNAPMVVEHQVIEWLKEAMNWPESGSGVLTSGCSMGNIIALASACRANCGYDVRELGLMGGPPLTVYASSQCHHSVSKAVQLLGLGKRALRQIPVGPDWRIQLPELKATIRRDRTAGFRPVAVIGNLGTVNTGAIDPLDELATLCEEQDLWFHVDGAFGAFAWLSAAHRALLRGLQRCDSLAFDMHKWMYLPFDASCLLVRRAGTLEATFSETSAYMGGMSGGPGTAEDSFSDRSIEQSRRFRALKVWFALKTHGIDEFAKAVEANVEQAEHLSRRVVSEPELELCAPRVLNIVCFRYRVEGLSDQILNEINERLLLAIQTSGRAVPSHTTLGTRFCLRVANTNHRTKVSDFDFLIDQVLNEGRRIVVERFREQPV